MDVGFLNVDIQLRFLGRVRVFCLLVCFGFLPKEQQVVFISRFLLKERSNWLFYVSVLLSKITAR